MFTFIFCPPACSPEGDLRCLLALTNQYKPLTWTSIPGRDQIPWRPALPFSLMRSSRKCRLWTLSGSVVRGLWCSLSLPSVSNHAYTVTQRLSQYLPFPSPQVSLSDAPFLGAQGGDQSPLPPTGIGSCLGTGPGALPYPVAFLVSWSVPPMSQLGLSCLESQNTGRKENQEYHQVVRLLVLLGAPPL